MKAEKQIGTGSRIGIFIGAWTTAFWFGLCYLGISTFLAYVLEGGEVSNIEGNKMASVNALVGILLIIITILFLRPSAKTKSPSDLSLFKKYLIWALWFGTGCYFLILIFSVSSLLVDRGVVSSGTAACTTLQQQMSRVQSATIPIATDKGRGTAFAVNDHTTLLTAYHVIEGANRIYANYTTGEVPVSIIATAPEFDIALLKIEKPVGDFVHLSEKYSLADPVYGFGYPGNTYSAGQASLSAGILSRVMSNSDLKLNNEAAPLGLEIIQTDAALNPGNSGGALFNRCGVIGVISSKSDSQRLQEYGLVSEEGISFAISAKTTASRFNLSISAENPLQKVR